MSQCVSSHSTASRLRLRPTGICCHSWGQELEHRKNQNKHTTFNYWDGETGIGNHSSPVGNWSEKLIWRTNISFLSHLTLSWETPVETALNATAQSSLARCQLHRTVYAVFKRLGSVKSFWNIILTKTSFVWFIKNTTKTVIFWNITI